MQEVSIVDLAYVYLDLEVSDEGNVYRVGILSQDLAEDVLYKNLTHAYEKLIQLKNKGFLACGHNFRRFDYPYLIKQQPQLSTWQNIDTLELSVLAFPLQESHKLNKDYKQSEYSSNNPLEDARASRLLLHNQLEALLKKPQEVQQVYVWLLTCGSDDASVAYQKLFRETLDWKVEQPAIEALPQMMLQGMNHSYLQQLWSNPQSYDFDTRLCVAGLLAWNYECNLNESTQPFSKWLENLNGFQNVLESLRPLNSNEFTIRSYLEYFGISSFRPMQEEAVRAIINREYPLVLMPTGGGKSLCYQLPALMFHQQQKALTVVISPLQALMADQVADLEEAGFFFATFINGNLSAPERRQRLEELRSGAKGLLYISPEQLRSMSIRTLLEQRPPVLWVIDEAHCISQWGNDFRPDYRYIPKFIQELYREHKLPKPLLALMTATATLQVQEDIKNLFAKYQLNIGCTINKSTARSNLTFEVVQVTENKDQMLLSKVKDALNYGGGILVYTTTRKNAEKLANLLNQSDIHAKYYHGKLSKDEKQEVLQAFKSGELNVVTATCAFGMGINRKDVRAVIHHCMSANLEGYVQEAGRAGRDGRKPSICTLLYDPKDAETVFFLQSLNQLSEQDLRNTFISARNIRNRILGGAKEDWFWVTANEIFMESELDEEFGQEAEQRNTKIKVALHYLENFGLLERAENLSIFIQFELLHDNFKESIQRFEQYSQKNNLSRYEAENFERLIQAMYVAKVHCGSCNEPFPLDRLSDEAGISLHDLTYRIRELQKAEICNIEIPLTLLVTKGVKGDAHKNHERLRNLEEKLLCELSELLGSQKEIQINLRGLASRLDPDSSKKIRASSIMDILEGWVSQQWIKLRRVNRDVVRLRNIEVAEHLPRHKALASSVLEILYLALKDKAGARLPLKYELGKLAAEVTQKTQLAWDSKELEIILLWLHQRKIIRVADGLNLFQQSLKIRVIKSANISKVTRRYPEVQAYYDEQTRRTHYMMHYGQLESPQRRQQFITDYFGEQHQEFQQKYQLPPEDVITRPVDPEIYRQIVEPLNPSQREIVLASDPALAVIAGPGSGKTRTIVHRIAYLVKVKRVKPQQILALAYNRNAVRELRVRLQKLIGAQASRIRVFTFHGLALALLGRTIGEHNTQNVDFGKLLIEACKLIAEGEEFENSDEDTQARRIKLLGNLEYIFVDEYQDVSENEYRLIKLIAGLNESEDKSRPVQINLCVIGDDDQNIYEFRRTNNQYIIQFEEEYKAKRLLLTENYRSTESIIQAANNLIRNNPRRLKCALSEQVRIDERRVGHTGLPVEAYTFGNIETQAMWVQQRIQSWIQQGVEPRDIAVLARQWNNLNPIRLLLERVGIKTYSLKTNGIKFVKNLLTCKLIDELKSQANKVFTPSESVCKWLAELFKQWNRSLEEPTAKTLLKIASNIDQERGFGSEELAVPIGVEDILTAIFEFNESPEVMTDDESVLVTSCHGAKGLEFKKVVLLADGFNSQNIESERRLFYVAMTRAKEELVLCSTTNQLLVSETGINSTSPSVISSFSLPQRMFYSDLTPSDVYLGHQYTRCFQAIINNIQEGARLQLQVNTFNNRYNIYTSQGQLIGALSNKANSYLAANGLNAGCFQFLPGEVTVKSIYHHLKLHQVTGEVIEDWFVVIPQIRICR